jgi:tetratricopeptide (TPR) repeat protein
VDPVIRKAQSEIDRTPNSPAGYVNLAVALMKEARKTGDFSFNAKAHEAVNRALEIDATDVSARKLAASLDLANHRFADAIEAATKLNREYPGDSFVYGVLTDAYIEVGDYAKAIESAQKMVDFKPGTASYSRVAQLRSLHGDHKGAVEMFTQAARASDPNDQETLGWCLVQLGDEYWKNGNYPQSEKIYDEALDVYPGYFLATVSKGRLRASMGDYAGAERLLTDVQVAVPNANATHYLGLIFSQRGDADKAARQYEKFEAMQAELGDAADHRRIGLLWADTGKIAQALELAENEYAAEKGIYSADLLAWSLYRSGKAAEARPYIREAMRLKTRDATLFFHAGMIEKANGDMREAARLLNAALKLNPEFDPVHAVEAKKTLAGAL